MKRNRIFPFRIGTTSYIVQDDLVANARFLADKVDDMQLVLFDIENGPSNIPAPQVITELGQIGAHHGLTYSIHLLEDVQWGNSGDHSSLRSARRLFDLFRPLQPSLYVLHLDGRTVRDINTPPSELERWQARCVLALNQLGEWLGDKTLLAVENLEHYPPELVTPVVEQAGVSRCLDVGHLWLDGIDPLPHLRSALPRTRIVHLHGLKDGQDHQSIRHMPPRQLTLILDCLWQNEYRGILTLEIFEQADFDSSMVALTKFADTGR